MKRNLTIFALAFFIITSTAMSQVTVKQPRYLGPDRNPSIVDVVLNINNATATDENPGQFSILIAALQAADPAIIATLAGDPWSTYTVFAPTDAAFVELLGELGLTAEELLAEQELVSEVLKFHVLNGSHFAFRVVKSSNLLTLNGEYIFQEGGVLTDVSMREANIIAVDIPTVNGVIHVIDRVILPIDIR